MSLWMNGMKSKIREIKKKAHLAMNYCFQWGYSMIHPIEKKVVFESMAGKQYSCNPRAISEKMHELYPDYKIVWGLTNSATRVGIPDYISVVERNSIAYQKELASCFAFVTNENIDGPRYKRRKQYIIQTWHGDRGYKKVLYEAWGEKERPIAIADGKVTDLYIAGSKYGELRGRKSFHYSGEILCIGMPRNDRLVNPSQEEITSIKKQVGIDAKKKVLLYAPTFRDNLSNQVQHSNVDIQDVLLHLNSKDPEWICLYRAHPSSKGLCFDNANGLIDVTNYPDMADLLIVADMLLTDYSGCAGDFILRKKPTLFAMFDLDVYKKQCREFRFDMGDAGFIIAKSQNDLTSIIDTYSEADYSENCEQLIRYFGINETGKSAETICRRLEDTYNWRFLK